jgi:acetyl-CoA acetyltransferase
MSQADIYVVGAYSSSFGNKNSVSFKDLVRETVLGVLGDADGFGGDAIDVAYVGNSGMGAWGQASIRGQVVLSPLVADGVLKPGLPVVNVENACATGTIALRGAMKIVRWLAISGGISERSVATRDRASGMSASTPARSSESASRGCHTRSSIVAE